jgi:CrcB protein
MNGFLVVAVGSALGGISRYGLNVLLSAVVSSFPLSTWIVNVVGAFLMGCLFGVTQHTEYRTSPLFLMLTTGYLGGLTTFSAFTAESATLIQQGKYLLTIGHTLAHVIVSLMMFFLGFAAGKLIRIA